MTEHRGVWREPPAETSEYPGLVVDDGRVSGSIAVGRSRLPLWAFLPQVVLDGWGAAEDYEPAGFDGRDCAGFVHHLFELRGEFARLLLVLADAERCEMARGHFNRPWWRTKRHRKRVGDQLRRCLAALEDA